MVAGQTSVNNAAGLIIVAEHRMNDERFLKQSFVLAKQLGPNLLDSGKNAWRPVCHHHPTGRRFRI